jgi:hypothetical protein
MNFQFQIDITVEENGFVSDFKLTKKPLLAQDVILASMGCSRNLDTLMLTLAMLIKQDLGLPGAPGGRMTNEDPC